MKNAENEPAKYEIEPKVYLNITKKGMFDNKTILEIMKFTNYEIHWLQVLGPKVMGFKNKFEYFPYKEDDLITFVDNSKSLNEDFSFYLSHNSIGVYSYYYINGASYLKVSLSYEYFSEHKTEIISKLDEFVVDNNVLSLCLEHSDCFNHHKNRNMIRHLKNSDYNYENIVFEVFKDQKYYRILGNDIKTEDNIDKYLIGIDKEYLAAHDHYCYKDQIWLGVSWLMYFNIEDYKHYLNHDKLQNYETCYENIKINKQYQRITLYQDIDNWQHSESINNMWTFRNKLGIDEMAHKLLTLPYPYLTYDELLARKKDNTSLIEIDYTENFDYLYYYLLFHINNNFEFCYNHYINFLKDLISYKYHFSHFQLSENRDYFTISLATYAVELAYDGFNKKILDFSYNSLYDLDDIIKQYIDLFKKNPPVDEQKHRVVEYLACYLIMVLVVNEGIELVNYGRQKPIGYLEINKEPIDIEVKLNNMLFNTKKGLFFKTKQESIVDYYNQLVSKIVRN